jgi:hypothetical protein
MKNQIFIVILSVFLFASIAGTRANAQLNCMSCNIPNANYVFMF